jgi:RHS repeat-associated protein
MKTQKINPTLLSVVLFSLLAAQVAFAVYDPSTGRWLQRDALEHMERDPRPAVPGSSKGEIAAPEPHANLYEFNVNNPISFYDPLGLDPRSDMLGAIESGDPEQIKIVIETWGDALSPELRSQGYNAIRRIAAQEAKRLAEQKAAQELEKKLSQEAANRLKSKAEDIIARECKGSINRRFPEEMKQKTLEEIERRAKEGYKPAQTAKKLLESLEYKKKELCGMASKYFLRRNIKVISRANHFGSRE